MAENIRQHPAQTVSAIAVIDLAQELCLRGCLQTTHLKELGPEFQNIRQLWQSGQNIQEERLAETLMRQLWKLAEQHSEQSCLGLHIGAKVNPEAKGILANWLAQCDNLSDAFEVFSQHIYLLNPAEHWHKEVNQQSVKLSFSFQQADYPFMAVDRSLAALLAWGAYYLKRHLTAQAVHLKRPPPQDIKPYERYLGSQVLFSQNEDAVYFSYSDFQQAIDTANPYLKNLIAEQASKIEQDPASTPLWKERVLILLKDNLKTFAHIEVVCTELKLSRSSLYRKLKVEGCSFSSLLKQERIRCLREAQIHRWSAADTAERLGFEDIASFYRFKRQHRSSLDLEQQPEQQA